MDTSVEAVTYNKQTKPADAKAVETKKASAENLSLPFTQIKRIVASHLASDAKLNINKEATLAFSEAAKVFISYISSAASDISKEKKRQTISSSDVITALEELDFGSLVPPLKEFLMLYQRLEGEKKAKKQAAAKLSKEKKRKTMNEAPAAEREEGEAKEEEAEERKADE